MASAADHAWGIDDFDWGLGDDDGQTLSSLKQEMTVSVSLELNPRMTEAVALMSGIPLDEVSQFTDTHIQRGQE